MFQAFWCLVMLAFCVCSEVRFLMVGMHGFRPHVAAGVARGSTVRGPAWAGVSSFLTGYRPGSGLGEAGREHLDLGSLGDGRLGGGGVRELRAGFLRAFGVPLPAGDVEGVQGGAGGGVRCGGERFQR